MSRDFASTSSNERHQRDDEKNYKTNLRDHGRGPGQGTKSKYGGDDCNNEKNDSVVKHSLNAGIDRHD